MEYQLKNKRVSARFSQEYMAEKLGMSRPTYIKTEQGTRSLSLSERTICEAMFSQLEEETIREDLRINIPIKNIEKFKQILIYILNKVGAKPNVGMTVLYKLLYFIDFDYYEKYETQCIGLTYIKNTYGPTPREFKKTVDDSLTS